MVLEKQVNKCIFRTSIILKKSRLKNVPKKSSLRREWIYNIYIKQFHISSTEDQRKICLKNPH